MTLQESLNKLRDNILDDTFCARDEQFIAEAKRALHAIKELEDSLIAYCGRV